MNKLCRLITALCILAMPYSISAKSKIKIKPSLSISLNKQSISTEVENKYYMSSLSGGSGLIKKFAEKPFGEVDSVFTSGDSYLGPGLTYIDANFKLKKVGLAQADAATTDAINGDKLLALLTSASAAKLNLLSTNGSIYVPFKGVRNVGSVTYLDFYEIQALSDGMISLLLSGSTAYSYIISGSAKNILITPASGTPAANMKYYTLGTSTDKYYLVVGTASSTPENNFQSLVAKDLSSDALTYTQMDYEYVDFYGITLGIMFEYAISPNFFLNIKSDITTPIEKLTHTGKFVTIKPEADISFKGGFSFGNEHGAVGFLTGVNYDRFSAHIKNFVTPTNGAYLASNRTQVKEFSTHMEIMADISVTDQLVLHFSSVLSASEYAVDLKGSNKRSPVTEQRFSAGLTMNY